MGSAEDESEVMDRLIEMGTPGQTAGAELGTVADGLPSISRVDWADPIAAVRAFKAAAEEMWAREDRWMVLWSAAPDGCPEDGDESHPDVTEAHECYMRAIDHKFDLEYRMFEASETWRPTGAADTRARLLRAAVDTRRSERRTHGAFVHFRAMNRAARAYFDHIIAEEDGRG